MAAVDLLILQNEIPVSHTTDDGDGRGCGYRLSMACLSGTGLGEAGSR